MRFKKQWREAAEQYARACWHSPNWRYWSFAQATKVERADTAMRQYRCELSYAAQRSKEHPKSKKQARAIFEITRELVRIGRYALEIGQ
jgi:hypothetical protein